MSESIIRTDEKVAHKRIEDQIQTFSLEEINELREINKKLFEDNQTLFRECVRLRKVNPSKPSALYP